MVIRYLAMVLLFVSISTAAGDENECKALSADGYQSGMGIPGHDAVREVTGTGRLQFYSAPDLECKMPGVFVIPKDRLIAYVEYKGYTAVLYIGGKDGGEPMGWVLSSRLRETGTGISPRQ